MKLPEAVRRAVDKGDYTAAQAAVLAALKDRKVEYRNTRDLNLAMLHEWMRVTGADVLGRYAAEEETKKEFLASFARDAGWLELYLGCGLVPAQKSAGMDVLYRIWMEEGGKVKNKPLAVALASCWGGGEAWPEPPLAGMHPGQFNPVRRYQFFQRQEARGLMHPNYPRLKPWELRFVVAIPQQDWEDASYEFAARAINLPWDKYHLAFYATEYTATSKFGDSVQGGAFNLPYADVSLAETTLRNGGVCGAMSHLAAVAAMAHGIPAYTCGQPGHCAYGVRPERGKWVGGFGGPDGGMHNYIFGNRAPTHSNLMEAVFGDDEKVARAYRKSFCARALEALGRDAAAEEAWKSAVKDSPLHPWFRKALHAQMMKRKAPAAECYEYLIENLLRQYEGHGVAAMEVMEDLVQYMGVMEEKHLLNIYHMLHRALAVTQSSWAVPISELVKKHAEALPGDAARQQYLTDMFTEHMKRGDGAMFGQLLEWAVNTYVATDSGAALFNKAFARAAQSAAGSPAEPGAHSAERSKQMLEAYGKAIIAAEQARSAPAFAALTQGALALEKSDYKADALEKMGEMQGQPAPGTLFRISTTSKFDTPALHAGIMTPEGGKCHTAREERPSFIVELKEMSFVAGCIVRKTPGQEQRMKKAVVYTSEDGATWFKRAEVESMPREWAVQLPDGVRARWIKLEFENPYAEFAHITHFVPFVR